MPGASVEEVLEKLAKNDIRFTSLGHRIARLQDAKFRTFINALVELEGYKILLKFNPKRGEFDRVNDSVAKLSAKIEGSASDGVAGMEKFHRESADLFDLWGDGMLFALPHILNNLRSSLFQSLRGSVQISTPRDGAIISCDLLFYQYESVVRSLIGYRAKDSARMKRYHTTKSKKAPKNPIFFWMQGTVPSKENLLHLLPEVVAPSTK